MALEYYEVSGVLRNGSLVGVSRQAISDALRRFPDGPVTVRIEKFTHKRSSAQNRFFHGPVVKAFGALGYRPQEAKDMLCLRFIPQEIQLMDGSIVLVPGHTSALTVPAFNEFLDACIQLAAENDVYIEDAEEWRDRRTA